MGPKGGPHFWPIGLPTELPRRVDIFAADGDVSFTKCAPGRVRNEIDGIFSSLNPNLMCLFLVFSRRLEIRERGPCLSVKMKIEEENGCLEKEEEKSYNIFSPRNLSDFMNATGVTHILSFFLSTLEQKQCIFGEPE